MEKMKSPQANIGVRSRKQASITNGQGIAAIKDMIQTIDHDTPLRTSFFGISVRRDLVSMKARLSDGAFFSHAMEKALHNWNIAINRNTKPEPDTLQ